MNRRILPIALLGSLALVSFSPRGYAQPRPGDHDHPGAAAIDYRAKLVALEDQRRAQRAALRKDVHAWDADRDKRADEHRKALETVWGDWIHRPECRAELELNADHLARVNRIIDLAEDAHNAALLARARAVRDREIARHARIMQELRVRLGVQ
jgi:hypothetical protein